MPRTTRPDTADQAALLATPQARFAAHPQRHAGLDWAALRHRLDNHPAALAVVGRMVASSVELLTEAQEHALQQPGEFDLKTSSWLATPAGLRALGGALFGDRRYGRVFVYNNGVQSHDAARGWRRLLRV